MTAPALVAIVLVLYVAVVAYGLGAAHAETDAARDVAVATASQRDALRRLIEQHAEMRRVDHERHFAQMDRLAEIHQAEMDAAVADVMARYCREAHS